MHRSLVVLTLGLLACAGASTETDTRDSELNGGIPAGNLYPAVGLLSSHGLNFCTGTLIAPDIVLTAAHCVVYGPAPEAFFTGGGAPTGTLTETPPNMVRHAVNGWVEIRGYGGQEKCPSTGDLALVHLSEPITDITPMKFATADTTPASRRCEVVGFGFHRGPDAITVKEKRWGFMNLDEIRGDAVRAEKGDTPATSDGTPIVLPAGDDPNGYSDHGDSGGPVLCGDVIYAVTSCGRTGATDGWNSMTGSHAQWLADSIASWPSFLLPP